MCLKKMIFLLHELQAAKLDGSVDNRITGFAWEVTAGSALGRPPNCDIHNTALHGPWSR